MDEQLIEQRIQKMAQEEARIFWDYFMENVEKELSGGRADPYIAIMWSPDDRIWTVVTSDDINTTEALLSRLQRVVDRETDILDEEEEMEDQP